MGAVTTGVYLCGITADSAYACWPDRAQGELLCTFAPWQTELHVYGYNGALPTRLVEADPNPWAIEMADGSRCVGRSGGAWGFPPAGFDFGYICPDTTPNKMIYIRTGGELFDTSGTEWTVFYGVYGVTPSPTPVTKIYYSAAEQ